MGKLDGKVALVTGSGQGIGRAIAVMYAKEGASVVMATRTVSKAAEVQREIEASGGNALAVACDVKDRDQVKHAVDVTLSTYGTVDILVNCAQEYNNNVPFIEHTDEQIDRVHTSGFRATVWFMQECFPVMRPKGGKIINFGSNGGTSSPVGFLAYGSNKEAIRAATRVAAREWGQYGINVNTIDPLAMTPGLAAGAPPEALQMIAAMAPLGRIASAEDIAQIALFLASSDSDVLTGYTFFGDCGLCIDTAR